MQNKRKQKRKVKPISRAEFIFNVVSLVTVIVVGIYFGVRSFYYYNVENFRVVEQNQTLNGIIINNNKVTVENDGFHHDTEGYYFKGNVNNNYVKFANRIFRVLRINENGEIKVVSDSTVGTFMWGEGSYNDSNLKTWLSTDQKLGVYYKTIPNPRKFLVKTNYSEDRLNGSKVISNKKINKDFLTTLTIADYSNVNGKNSFLNNGHAFWLLGTDNAANNLYVDNDGSVLSTLGSESFGVRVVFTFKKDILISSGNGTLEDPYVINQGSDINYVDSFVKLGDDVWKVSYDDGNILKMYLTRLLSDVFVSYGSSSLFNYNDRGSIANYLNYSYFDSLPYKDLIFVNDYYTGEVSEEFSYKYENIYSDKINCKVALLNMFDYYSGDLDNFFLMNTTSSVGRMVYVYRNMGMLEEVKIDEEKFIVPVISIKKEILKKGNGTFDDPYTL